jgi:hypothetical protein
MSRTSLTKLAVLLCLFAMALWALTGRATPSADTAATGGFTAAPLWSKINDTPDDADDSTVITSGSNPSTIATFSVVCPADVGTITAAALRIRAKQNNVTRNISVAVAWSATAGTSFNTGTLNKTALTNYTSGSIGSLNISKAACDASTISFTPTTTGTSTGAVMTVDSFGLDITYTAGAARKSKPVVVIGSILPI